MSATPNPIVNLANDDGELWTSAGNVSLGASGVDFSLLVACKINDVEGDLELFDNRSGVSGIELQILEESSVGEDQGLRIRARVGTGAATTTLYSSIQSASGVLGHNLLIGLVKDTSDNLKLFINGAQVASASPGAFAPASTPITFGGGAGNEFALGVSSCLFVSGRDYKNFDMADIYNWWRQQGRLLESPTASGGGTVQVAYEVSSTVQPLATADLYTIANLGSLGTAADVILTEDSTPLVQVDQIINTAAWDSPPAGGLGHMVSQYTTTPSQTGIVATADLEMFSSVDFDSDDFTVTSDTVLTADRAGRYEISTQWQLTQTAGAVDEVVTLSLDVAGSTVRSVTNSVAGSLFGGAAALAFNMAPVVVDLTAGQTIESQLALPGAGNTYTLTQTNSWMRIQRIG